MRIGPQAHRLYPPWLVFLFFEFDSMFHSFRSPESFRERTGLRHLPNCHPMAPRNEIGMSGFNRSVQSHDSPGDFQGFRALCLAGRAAGEPGRVAALEEARE